jgi:2-polyprenyl-3-methyl-5-hydroxy-6-metoxy-1,4-benzoquinol methylase
VSGPASSLARRGRVARARERWFRPASSYWRPELYERYFTRTPVGALLRRRDDEIVHAALDRLVEPGHAVLEVGAGTGHYTVPIARRCARVVALDAAPDMVDYLRERVEREGLTNVEASGGHLPDGLRAPGPFDGVVCLGVLGYVDDLEGALRALAERLRPGAWALVSMPPRSLEGRVHVGFEVAGRRRVSLRSPEQAIDAARAAGLRVERQERSGLTTGGITLLLEARREGPDGAAGR